MALVKEGMILSITGLLLNLNLELHGPTVHHEVLGHRALVWYEENGKTVLISQDRMFPRRNKKGIKSAGCFFLNPSSVWAD